MRLHFSLVSTLFFAFSAIADRRREHRRSRYLNRDASDAIEYNPVWAGAVVAKDYGTITSVTGTFRVPVASGNGPSFAAIWVGMDGHTCENGGLFQVGIDANYDDNHPGPTYDVWSEWFPDLDEYFSLTISGGDEIRATVTAFSATSGIAMIENLTTGSNETREFRSSHKLCGRDAEWIVEDGPYANSSTLLPFDNFGQVTFKEARATGPGGTFTPKGGVLLGIEQNGVVLASTMVDGDDLIVKHA